MNKIIQKIEQEQLKKEVTKFNVGDSVRVHTVVKEGEKERIQIFTGIVIGRTNLPLVYEGDALFHVASLGAKATWQVDDFHDALEPSDDEIDPEDLSSAPIAG